MRDFFYVGLDLDFFHQICQYVQMYNKKMVKLSGAIFKNGYTIILRFHAKLSGPWYFIIMAMYSGHYDEILDWIWNLLIILKNCDNVNL